MDTRIQFLAAEETKLLAQKMTESQGRTISDASTWVQRLNKEQSCGPAKECSQELRPSPKGTVPGFW